MKRKHWFLVIPWVAFLTFSVSHGCIAGVVVEQVVKDKEGRASKVVLYFSENRFRTDHQESGLSTIIDFREDQMVMIDHRSKGYIEVKFSRWEKEISERLKKDLPSTRPRKKKITVRKSGETAIINRFQTEKIEVLADGKLIEENWVTREVNMEEMGKVMDKLAQGFSKEFKSEMREGREIYEKLKPYGFPILVKDYSITYGLEPIEVLEVIKLERKDLREEVFLPPISYERIFPAPPKK
jgi:hypothetical protein